MDLPESWKQVQTLSLPNNNEPPLFFEIEPDADDAGLDKYGKNSETRPLSYDVFIAYFERSKEYQDFKKDAPDASVEQLIKNMIHKYHRDT